jgi:hypothetical protein
VGQFSVMTRSNLASAVSACLLAVTYSHAACLNGHPSVVEEYNTAKAVVVATVVGERLIPSAEGDFYNGTLYRVRVDRTFRGTLGNQAEIFSDSSSHGFR